MKETPAPDPFLAYLDEDLVNCLLLPVLIGDLSTRALWRRHPRLPELQADIEAISGLTRSDVVTLSACNNDRARIACEFVLRPARLHAFMALGAALWDSPLRETPFLRFLDEVEGSETEQPDQTAAWVFDFMESRQEPPWLDFPADFEPSAEFVAHFLRAPDAVPTPEVERAFIESAPEVVTRTGDELRWRRLQLESVIGRAGEVLRTIGEAERILLAPDNPQTDEADTDEGLRAYYHDECLELDVKPLIRAMLAFGLLSARSWYRYSALPFARAAGELRWLRRQDAVEALRKRIEGLAYADPQDMTTGVTCSFSLAELLTLYQSLESLALAAINDLLPAITALRVQDGQDQPAEISDSFPVATAVLTDVLDVGHPFGQFFYRNVPTFVRFLEDQLTVADDREELARARAEIAALAELATSPGAV